MVANALQPWINLLEQTGDTPTPALIEACHQVLRNVPFHENDAEMAFSVTRVAKAGVRGPGGARLAADIATRMVSVLRTAYSLAIDFEELRELLLQREPEAVLTALCQGNQRTIDLGVKLLGQEMRDGGYPMCEVETDRLMTWCSEDPGARVPFALRVVRVIGADPNTERPRLTDQAMALLQLSTTPEAALLELVERMEQQSYRNGRGAAMINNAEALDAIFSWYDTSFQAFARSMKERLVAAGKQQLDIETAQDRVRNERFE